LPIGSANGLAFVQDGYGTVLKIQFIKKLYGQQSKSEKSDDGEDEKKSESGSFTHTGRLGETFTEST
jgi:hypothetical protein